MKKSVLSLALAAMLLVSPAFAAEEAKAPEFEYYNVPTMLLPVITEKGLTQQVSIAISIELPYGKREDVAAYGPRLVDAYIRDLFGAMSNGQVMVRGNVLDVEKLKTRLTAVTEKVLGNDKDKVRGLFLQAVRQHQI